jgi:putative DNA primase/helicase
MTKPLTRIEEEWRREYEQEGEAYTLEQRKSKLEWEAWDQETKKAIKRGAPGPQPPAKARGVPVQKRLILSSATFEKLHEILRDNPAGVFVLRDELTGWFAELDKQGRETERQFYLEAWSGDTPFTVDRIGRGSVYVPATCVSLLGNIQPARLRLYLSDAVVGGPSDDGLIQRFQILVWPDPPREWKLIDRPPNNYALAKAEKVFSRLANLSPDSPLEMRFDCESQELFFEWLAELETKVRSEHGLHPAMVAHLSKYRSLMPSLAALLELADRAAADGELEGKITVSIEHAKQAAALCEYLESHAKRVYACIVFPELRAARELARHLQAGDLKNPFSTREVYLKGWSGLEDPERVRSACKLLEDAGWIREEAAQKSQNGGRPSETWQINPKVVRREK